MGGVISSNSLYIKSMNFALFLARLGFRVFPVHGEGKRFKAPKVAGWKKIKYSEEQIHETQKRDPKTLWGIHCDQGFWVLDLDTHKTIFNKSKKSQKIFEKVKQLKIKQTTIHGGQHYFFKGKYKNTASALAPAIDTKSENGYVILYENPTPYLKIETKQDFIDLLPTIKTPKPKEKPPLFQIGTRNDDLFRKTLESLREGHPENIPLFIQAAKNSGLPNKEIAQAVKSAKRTHFENLGKDEEEYIPHGVQEADYKVHTPLIDGLLLHYSFNMVGGPLKIGKSRALMALINYVLSLPEMKGKEAVILSSENNKNMLIPLILALRDGKKVDNIKIIKSKVRKDFDAKKFSTEKIAEMIERVRLLLSNHDFEILLIDPMPRFFNWNSEAHVTFLVEGLQEVAEDTKTCIIGVRNDGKSKEYDEAHRTKGSSALEDIVRLLLRAVPVHPDSEIGKVYEGKKTVILTSQFVNSLMQPKASVITLDITNFKGHDLALPLIMREITDKKMLQGLVASCSKASGKSAWAVIYQYLMKHKIATFKEIQREHPFKDYHTLYRAIERAKETKKLLSHIDEETGEEEFYLKGAKK